MTEKHYRTTSDRKLIIVWHHVVLIDAVGNLRRLASCSVLRLYGEPVNKVMLNFSYLRFHSNTT